MKFVKSNKYFTISIYVFLTVGACICFNELVKHFPTIIDTIKRIVVILKPFFYGFAVAYLLSPTQKRIIKLLRKPIKKPTKAKDGLLVAVSIVFTYVVFVGILYAFGTLFVPHVAKSVAEIKANIDVWSKSFVAWSESALQLTNGVNIFDLIEGFGIEDKQIVDALKEALGFMTDLSRSAVVFFEGLFKEITNLFVGVVISIYMLVGGKSYTAKIKMTLNALLPDVAVDKLCSLAREADKSFGGYIKGQLTDSVVVAAIWLVVMTAFGFPHPFLISLIVGVTNMIPFFGPIIGGVPSAILIMLTKPEMTIWFIIMLIVIQQIDGNLIAPKIIGGATGIPAFWIIFALLIFGDFFGVLGMIIAVPVFSLIYNEAKRAIFARLKSKGKSCDVADYS